MSVHYEWWSKAGGGPGYTSQIEPEEYIKKTLIGFQIGLKNIFLIKC